MPNADVPVDGSEKLIETFGYWPSFHDAEVIELHLSRGDVNPDARLYVFPVLTTRLHLWELTDEVDPKGHLVQRCHTLATLRFHDVDDFKMEGFNHQNAILGISISSEERGSGLPPYRVVHFKPAFGITASFKCFRIEVVEALPCDEQGRITS
jgi:hypothetical protein